MDKPLASIGELLALKEAEAQATSQGAFPTGWIDPAVLLGQSSEPAPVTPAQAQPRLRADASNPDNHPRPSGPVKPAPFGQPQPDAPRHPHQQPFRYYVEQGLLLYNNSTQVLLDRQVLPFADPQKYWFNRDLCHFRSHVLMEASDPEHESRMVLDDVSRSEGQQRLHPTSQCVTLWPQSMMGFLGQHCQVTHGPFRDRIQALASFGLWGTYQEQSFDQVAAVFPSFYIQVDAEHIARINGLTVEQLLRTWMCLEMVNPLTGRKGWYKLLTGMSPITCGLPLLTDAGQIRELEMCLWQNFLFQQIYIGMSSVGLPDWQNNPPRQLDPNHAYTRLIQQTVPLATLALPATDLGLRSREFFVAQPPGMTDGRAEFDKLFRKRFAEHMERLLNLPAEIIRNRMLGNSSPESMPIVEMTGT